MTIQIVRRWAMVMAGVALLGGLPVIASALPVSLPQLTAAQLRTRILAWADEPYAGYAESNATFGLPPVAGLTGLTSLLNGVTKIQRIRRECPIHAAPTTWLGHSRRINGRARVAGGGTRGHTNVPGTREHQGSRADVRRRS